MEFNSHFSFLLLITKVQNYTISSTRSSFTLLLCLTVFSSRKKFLLHHRLEPWLAFIPSFNYISVSNCHPAPPVQSLHPSRAELKVKLFSRKGREIYSSSPHQGGHKCIPCCIGYLDLKPLCHPCFEILYQT